MRGNPQALFGKRPTEKDPAKDTSPAVDFTLRGRGRSNALPLPGKTASRSTVLPITDPIQRRYQCGPACGGRAPQG